jgi:hypothetical protein
MWFFLCRGKPEPILGLDLGVHRGTIWKTIQACKTELVEIAILQKLLRHTCIFLINLEQSGISLADVEADIPVQFAEADWAEV